MIPRTIQTAVTALLLFCTFPACADIVATWVQDQGTAPFAGANTSNPVLGDGSNNSADNIAVSGSLSGSLTAGNLGDTIQMTGSMTLTGISTGNVSGELGFGIFNTNGSANATGWLGYLATNSDLAQVAPLWERNVGNTTIYASTTGATQISSAVAPGNPGLTAGTYSFSLSLTRQAGNAMDIAYSLTRTSSAGYSLSGTFTDPSVNTFTFDRVAFVFANSLNADQVSLSNVNFSVVPEPSALVLLPVCILVFLVRRRRGFDLGDPLHVAR